MTARRNKIHLVIILLLAGLLQPCWAQEKLAQTGFQFLSVDPDARASSLAGAMTTVENQSAAIWANPAMLAESKHKIDVHFSQNKWIADIVHNAFALSVQPGSGQYGVIAFHGQFVDYGEVDHTIVAYNGQGYLDLGKIKPSAYSFGIAYAKQLSNKFSVGGQVKWVNQDLGGAIANMSVDGETQVDEIKKGVVAFDFGTIYKTGFKSLAFGMSVRNFSQEIKFAQESFQLPLTFSIGFSANLVDFFTLDQESPFFRYVLFTVDAVHPRSHPEYIKTGFEYRFLEILSFRLGYMSNIDEAGLTYGIGISQFGFQFDYAYIPYGVFDNVQRFTVRFAL